jgi:uncharacterized protein YndB with AHSA1/START domain
VGAEAPSVEMTREFPAPPERVIELMTNPGQLAKWWGPRGFSIPSVDFVPRAGANYRIEMQPPEGEAFHLTGTFREVDLPSLLAFSFQWEPADPDDVETVARLSFEAVDDSTRVRLVQGPFKTTERCELHRDGWMESFDKLGDLLVRQR